MRLIEWVGQKSLFEEPRVEYALLTGQLTPMQKKTLREASRHRVFRVVGVSFRDMDAKDPGLSRSYRWGPHKGSYVQQVSDGDAELILRCSSRDEFRDVTHGVPEVELRIPDQVLQPISTQQFGDMRGFTQAFRT